MVSQVYVNVSHTATAAAVNDGHPSPPPPLPIALTIRTVLEVLEAVEVKGGAYTDAVRPKAPPALPLAPVFPTDQYFSLLQGESKGILIDYRSAKGYSGSKGYSGRGGAGSGGGSGGGERDVTPPPTSPPSSPPTLQIRVDGWNVATAIVVCTKETI